MKTLEHTFHLFEKNNQILVPVFFNVIMIQTLLSYFVGAAGLQDPQVLLQDIPGLISRILWVGTISGLLVLLVDSFFTSMTLSMVFEAWKKGKTKLDWNYGTKFFTKILVARIIYFAGAGAIFSLIAASTLLFSTSQLNGILLGGISVAALSLFLFGFFWVNESIVTKKKKPFASFKHSKLTSFRNPALTLRTIFAIFAFYIVAQAIIGIFSAASQIFLTALITLLATIFLKTLVSILKIVSFLQAK